MSSYSSETFAGLEWIHGARDDFSDYEILNFKDYISLKYSSFQLYKENPSVNERDIAEIKDKSRGRN
jgi:hypothetical protein